MSIRICTYSQTVSILCHRRRQYEHKTCRNKTASLNMCSGFLGAFAKLRKATISFVMSVRPSAWNDSAPTGRIFMKFDIWGFFENLSWKFKFHYHLTVITATVHEDRYTFTLISRSVLFRMRNVSDKSGRENQNTHFLFSYSPPRKSCRLWDNVEKYCRAGQATDDNMAHAHCMLDN